jgi:hypothetical protein
LTPFSDTCLSQAITEMSIGLLILTLFFLPDILIFLTELTAIAFGYHIYTNDDSDTSIVFKNRIQLKGCWLEHTPKLGKLRIITTPLTVILLLGRLYIALT